jgi:hypothetical protein
MIEDAWRAKLHPRLRRLVEDDGTVGGGSVSLLLQVSGPVEDLAAPGFSIGNRAGDTVLARAPIAALEQIARHPSVVHIDISRGLFEDG